MMQNAREKTSRKVQHGSGMHTHQACEGMYTNQVWYTLNKKNLFGNESHNPDEVICSRKHL